MFCVKVEEIYLYGLIEIFNIFLKLLILLRSILKNFVKTI